MQFGMRSFAPAWEAHRCSWWCANAALVAAKGVL